MNSSQKLQAIFDVEIERLHKAATSAPLDSADIAKLEKLVAAYSKFKPQNFTPEETLDDLPTDDLLRLAKD